MTKQRTFTLGERKYFPYLLLTVIGLVCYHNSFFNAFLWDDESLILANEYIRSPINIFKIFSVDLYHWTVKSDFYRPIFSLSLMFDYRLWHLYPFGYHLTNFLLHLANSFLIFYFINFLIANKKIALIASLFFLVHPIHTEAVTYISGRADPLATLFVLLAVLFFAKSRTVINLKKTIYYLSSVFLFILGLLSKEIVLALPLLLILYDLCFSSFRKNIKEHLVFLLLAALYIILRNHFLPISLSSKIPHSLFLKIINLPKVISFYLYLLVSPFDLRVERFFPMSKSIDLRLFLSVSLFIFIVIGIIKSFRRSKIIFFFSLWFFINLLAIANIMLPLNAVVAEHWLYLPSIGFFAIIALGIDKISKKTLLFSRYAPSIQLKRACLIIIIATLSSLTVARNFEWNNGIILFERTLEASQSYPGYKNIRLRYNLGIAYYKSGRFDEAIEQYKNILKLMPDFEEVHYNLATAYICKGLYDEAEQECLKAIEIASNYIMPYYALGLIYKKRGNIEDARIIWDKMLKIKTNCRLCNLFREKVKPSVEPFIYRP